jgi:hypothetical protein
VICLEVIDLLLENDGPKIFAEELDYVQIVGEAGPISREAEGAIVREMPLKRENQWPERSSDRGATEQAYCKFAAWP